MQLLVSLSALHQCASHVFEAECHPQMAGAVQLIVKRLKDTHGNVRKAALEAIIKLASDGQFVSYSFRCT